MHIGPCIFLPCGVLDLVRVPKRSKLDLIRDLSGIIFHPFGLKQEKGGVILAVLSM